MSLVLKRASVRKFLDKKVEDEKITNILRAAMQAPSAKNQQPWEFCVITNKNLLDEISKSSPYTFCAKDALVAIVTCINQDKVKLKEYADIDLSACCENILIQAVEEGLGAVWLGIAPIEKQIDYLAKALNLEKNLRPFSIIPIGYPIDKVEVKERFDPNRIHYYK